MLSWFCGALGCGRGVFGGSFVSAWETFFLVGPCHSGFGREL